MIIITIKISENERGAKLHAESQCDGMGSKEVKIYKRLMRKLDELFYEESKNHDRSTYFDKQHRKL